MHLIFLLFDFVIEVFKAVAGTTAACFQGTVFTVILFCQWFNCFLERVFSLISIFIVAVTIRII